MKINNVLTSEETRVYYWRDTDYKFRARSSILPMSFNCGANERSSSSTSIIPLIQCNKETQKHEKFLKFSGVRTEVEHILVRCGCFEKPLNF